MHTTTLDSHAIYSHPHVDTAVVGEDRLRAHAPAVNLRRAGATYRRHGWMRTLLRCLLMAGLVVSCTSRSAAPPPTAPYPAPSLRIQYGLASWYGRGRHGRGPASGGVFGSNQTGWGH